MTQLRNVPAPAKLNLFLHVVGRRDDGYHLLQTVFRFIDLADTLHFTRRDDGLVQRVTEIDGVPPGQCLTVRAAQALQKATGCRFGVDIEVDKRIPSGGGLGGGSSDAASVLVALNRLWNTGLSRRQLMDLALPLGADVPVFVFGSNAFGQGIGEALQAVELPPRWYVVIQPQVQVPTADIFGDPLLTRDTPPVKILDFSSSQDFCREEYREADSETRQEAVGQGKSGTQFGTLGCSFGRNDLEPVVFRRFREVDLARQLAMQAVKRAGISSCSEVRMSGSGACLFIECVSQQQADTLRIEIEATIPASGVAANAIRSVVICAGLEKHPLQHWAV
nr:4-(cytidine 5'-diphospho)-2-C-methyl-D-erythritol kinase [Pseudomonas sp.]